ncbi:MAG TPA: SAM-dependent methyltransferase [Polyangia bacterium]|nr:SAM-dependent methyltransferase [Polyangia bacterium]
MAGHRGKLENILARIAREQPAVEDPEALVCAGRVWVGGALIQNPRALVRRDAALVIAPLFELRGTRKLRAALAAFSVPVAGRIAVDVGASSGGFVSALLEAGARRVYAVDVGYGQLRGRLRQDPRVVNHERTNLADLGPALLPEPVELVTMDLSYLSIARAAPQLARLPLAAGADLIALCKPMFELARASAPSDEESLAEAVRAATRGLGAHGFRVMASMRSPIPGRRGARELFVHARWPG